MAGDKAPSFQFYPRDYMADPAVQAMTWEQRGRYHWALCCSALSDTPGDAPETEWAFWMGYLDPEQWTAVRHIFVRAFRPQRGGRWHQVRMVSVFRQSRERFRQAQKGAALTNCKRWSPVAQRHDSDTIATAPASASASASASAYLEPKTLVSPDSDTSVSQPRQKPDPAKAAETAEWLQAFHEHFWPEYLALRSGLPNPKAAALAVWQRIKRRGQDTFDTIMADLDACKALWSDTEPRYIPHARKWLHERIRNGVFIPSEHGDQRP